MMYFIRPDLVDASSIGVESGARMGRLTAMPYGFTGIGWYANYPDHFAGEAVLGGKDGRELDPGCSVQQVDRAAARGVHPRVVGDHAHALAAHALCERAHQRGGRCRCRRTA